MSYRVSRIVGSGGTGVGSAPPADGLLINLANGSSFENMCVALHPSDGSIYITAPTRHVILRVDPLSNIVTVVAGTWDQSGFSGDGGPATAAKLDTPVGITFGPSGELYIADRENKRVRKISTFGTITTFAGTGNAGSSSPYVSYPCLGADLGKVSAVSFDTTGDTLWVATEVNTSGNKTLLRISSGLATSIVLTPPGIIGLLAKPASAGVYVYSKAVIYDVPYNGAGSYPSWKLDSLGQANWNGFGPDKLGGILVLTGNLYTDVGTGFPDYRGSLINRLGANGYIGLLLTMTGITGYPDVSGDPSSSFPADGVGSDITPLPNPAEFNTNKKASIVEDSNGIIYVLTPYYLYKHVPVADALTSYSSPTIVRTTTAGFSDANAIALLQPLLDSPIVADQSGSRSVVDLPSYIGGKVWLIGSSYSNADANQLETVNKILRQAIRGLIGVYKVDFQDHGTTGNGADFGSFAPRIHILNRSGEWMVERWIDPGPATIHDYGIVMTLVVGSNLLVYAAGIRDISTKAAVFAAGNCLDPAYAGFFEGGNAVIVHCSYPSSVTTPEDFVPTTSNTRIMKLSSVISNQPIVP